MKTHRLLDKHRLRSVLIAAAAIAVSSSVRADDAAKSAPGAAAVYGQDDRQRVSDTQTFPWSAVGMVLMVYGTDAYVGTGAMIGRRLVLTCAHVVNTAEHGRPDRIEFIPAVNGDSEPFGRIKVTRVVLAPQWQEYFDDGYDLAILVLAEPVGEQTGYFRIAVQPDSFFRDCKLATAGYPTDLGVMYQYTTTGNSYGIDGNVILHNLDSEPGQSGSPIWYGNASDGTLRLVGLIEGSYYTSGLFGTFERGMGSRINQQVANWIEDQLAANGDLSQDLYAPVEVGAKASASSRSFCGTGLGPWMVLAVVAWSVRLVSRGGTPGRSARRACRRVLRLGTRRRV